ncbi:hypothetical protein [Cellulomonas wangsupingiae]|uniref:Uncharacterized protein n=1 Tax=Cellulomonas wangsupingiae TaxID=2968085 RepID=A0ABY5K8F0_9CELL|nr:hypothetical protein [Cellulomonas wangsupingiae]MCC2333972.1 hypothetical protein [Cellulomonas wangsupingiae]MCM0640972.1 hypothetical protein [Cellulomonas wangsupingiae]UUI65226.1 hypothetical protein NP075_00315 [Cellulomonas wangsupingiae]
MSGREGTGQIPTAPPVDVRAYREEPGAGSRPWYRDTYRWLTPVFAAGLVLAWQTTDVAPAVLAAGITVMAVGQVQGRRGAVRRTVLEVGALGAVAVAALVLWDRLRPLPAGELAVQLVVGALAGAGVVALVAAVRRRRAARAARPTAV